VSESPNGPHQIRWRCIACQAEGTGRGGTKLDAVKVAVLRHRAISPRCDGTDRMDWRDHVLTFGVRWEPEPPEEAA
jgi:hypothetical protein